MKITTLFIVGLAIIAASSPASAVPLGTGITYQGVLTDAGTAVNGTVDLRFRLFDAATGGAELGVDTTYDLAVADGRVTTVLDFGVAFDGDARWLQVEVRDGASSGGFDVLPERQQLRPTPFGLYAADASHAATATHATSTAATATLDGEEGAHYRAFGNLTGIPSELVDGDDDTAAALSCAEGEMPTWNGASWVCDADDRMAYTRTAVVGPVGTPVANGAALIAAVGSLPVPSSGEEGWLIEVEPGLYDLGSVSLDLPPWTTLKGAGEIFTVVTSAVCSSASGITATILGDDHVEIRDLSVENSCATPTLRSRGVSFGWAHDAARLYRVTARTVGAAGGCAAVLNRSEGSVLDRVTGDVSGCLGQADAIWTMGINALLTDCIGTASGSGANHGLFVNSRSFVSRGAFAAADTVGNDDAAVVVDASADLMSVDADCADAAVRVISSHAYTVFLTRLIANGAVEVEDHGGSLLLIVEHSRIVASGPTVVGDTGASIGIAMTQLAGGPVSSSGGVLACAGIWDEFWFPYASACP